MKGGACFHSSTNAFPSRQMFTYGHCCQTELSAAKLRESHLFFLATIMSMHAEWCLSLVFILWGFTSSSNIINSPFSAMGDFRHHIVASFIYLGVKELISVLISWVKCSFERSTVASQEHLALKAYCKKRTYLVQLQMNI